MKFNAFRVINVPLTSLIPNYLFGLTPVRSSKSMALKGLLIDSFSLIIRLFKESAKIRITTLMNVKSDIERFKKAAFHLKVHSRITSSLC